LTPEIFIPDAHGTKKAVAGKWSQFMAPVSGAYVMGLRQIF